VSICTEWLSAAGGLNAIADVAEDNQTTVTMEEILKADPDYIIVSIQNAVGATQNSQTIIDKIKSSPEWSTIKAVKEGRIYANPVGTFLWARYSCEEALQVLWVAKLLHPDKFKDIDMAAKVREFYKTFYDYDMTANDAERMLAGLNPQ
jgi:iron complex transport system substrate-binding protein